MNSPVGLALADLAGIANSCLLGLVPPAWLTGGAFPIASGAVFALARPLARLYEAFTRPLPLARCAGSAGVRPWLSRWGGRTFGLGYDFTPRARRRRLLSYGRGPHFNLVKPPAFAPSRSDAIRPLRAPWPCLPIILGGCIVGGCRASRGGSRYSCPLRKGIAATSCLGLPESTAPSTLNLRSFEYGFMKGGYHTWIDTYGCRCEEADAPPLTPTSKDGPTSRCINRPVRLVANDTTLPHL